MMFTGYSPSRKVPSPQRALTAVALSIIVLMITGVFLVMLLHFDKDAVGPQQAFEYHLLALDEQQWELADTFVVERCRTGGTVVRENAGQDLNDLGFSFFLAFTVDEIWFNEDGQTVLLGLSTPENLHLPGVVKMERVDGDWLVSCS